MDWEKKFEKEYIKIYFLLTFKKKKENENLKK